MKYLNKIIFLLFASMLFITACKKEKLDTSSPIVDLGGETWAQGPIDKWILDSLTMPFNVEVLYRWNQYAVGDLNKTMTPPDEARVLPLLKVMKKIWIDPYIIAKGGDSALMKRYITKQIVLVGSRSFNTNGTETLGTADGGKKITLFAVNEIDSSNRAVVQRRMRTVHHEFAHIFHQTVMFTPDFERICVGDYTGDWTNQSEATALSKGFISPYAMSNKDEDFVETIAHALVYGPAGFDSIVNRTNDATGKSKIYRKIAMVKHYYKSVWDLDFDLLQAEVQKALNAVAPLPPPPPPAPLKDIFGFNLRYKSLRIDAVTTQASSIYNTAFNTAKAGLAAFNNNGGRYMDSILISLTTADSLLLRVRYINPANPTSFLLADYLYKYTRNADGSITLGTATSFPSTRTTAFGNGTTVRTSILALLEYFQGKTLLPKYPSGLPTGSNPEKGGLYDNNNANSFFIGNLNDTYITY
ncbi:zinc-binding metallopeptidase [Polluticaenibacter yanchengensis]|uniref:Zinc-binding metallopeptidase n=1 Tax=Polluticaenibacter yanchengensis TaxID=3014562 RepID=A0ABT4UPL5_9BACT|nr:putative zinc-binding metallopeptidase [Chitinophagaceae bacterium LY-5]